MTEQEHKQKRRECWEEFKRTNLDGEVQWQPVNRYDVFCAAFDRAYALGKHEKDAEDDRTLKVNRKLFCWLCADADDYINEHLEEDGSDYTYYQGRSDALHDLYRGECEDAEGEEMLMCEKSKIQRAYNNSREIVKAENPDSLMYSMHTQIMCVLENIFGSKCLPDELNEDNFATKKPQPSTHLCRTDSKREAKTLTKN